MQAVLLVGGLGTRLGGHTREVPKPMIMVHGKPFVEHLLLMLKGYGITRFHFCAGYRGQQVKDYFGSGEHWNIRVSYSFEKRLMGTGGALYLAADHLEESFFLINGDTFLSIDYRLLAKEFHSRGKTAMIVAYENREGLMRGNISLDESNEVICYRKNVSRAELTFVDAGVVILKREVLELIPSEKKVSFEEEIFPRLIELKQMAAFPTSTRFYDMGDPEGLKTISEVLK